ncbi:MAG: alkaline phosphatase family protein, partial [Burkholderiales bacterium]
MRILLVGLLAAFCAHAGAAQLVAGPMAGPADHRAITLWLQANGPAQARIEYWPVAPGQSAAKRQSKALPLLAETQFVGQVPLLDLQPGQQYAYRLLLDGKPASETLQFKTQPLWQWRTDAPDFTLLAGSCSFINEPAVDRPGRPYGDRHDIYKVMADQSPDLTLWLGDNIYLREVDWNRPDTMAQRWA